MGTVDQTGIWITITSICSMKITMADAEAQGESKFKLLSFNGCMMKTWKVLIFPKYTVN